MRTVKGILIVVTVFLISSCSGVKVITDIDDTEDFTAFKKFEFYKWQTDIDINRLDQERIINAFAEEATIRGLTRVEEDADVSVALFTTGQVKTETNATTTTTGMGGMNRRGMAGPGWGWGSTHSTTRINETQYLEGSIIVEMYDIDDKKLIWQAIGTSRISEKPEKRAKDLPKKIKAIMKKYPVKPLKE